MTFKPACICLELEAVLWYCPNERDVRLFTKPAKLVWLNTLVASQRNWNVTRSVTLVFFKTAQSKSWKPASGNLLRPRLPWLPSNGCVNRNPLVLVQIIAGLVERLTPRSTQRLSFCGPGRICGSSPGINAAAGLPAGTAWKLSIEPFRFARTLLPPTSKLSLTPRRAPAKMLALNPDWMDQVPVNDQPPSVLPVNPVPR